MTYTNVMEKSYDAKKYILLPLGFLHYAIASDEMTIIYC